MDDEELLAGNDAGEQDRHRLTVLAAGGIDGDQRAALDERAAFGRDRDVGTAGVRRDGPHASRTSWSVKVMVGVRLTNSGEMAYSACPPSSWGGQTVTAAIAAAGSPLQKQLNRQ